MSDTMDVSEASREKDRWEDLIYTGPNTPMGTIIRNYWQPALLASDLDNGKPARFKILGEYFTAYRGVSGRPYVVDDRCPHRGTLMKTGSVEGEEIRCLYHGWKFNGSGACTQAPAESDQFAARIKIRAVPAREYGGWVFVYLGGGEPPEFPRIWEIENANLVLSKGDIWPCNWLQLRENSYDPLHVNFTHRKGPLGEAVTETYPRVELQEFAWGFQTKAVRGSENERIVETWFPNSGHVIVPQPNDYSQPWIDLLFWHVPIDDEHCATYKIYASSAEGKVAQDLSKWFDASDLSVSAMHDELFEGGIPEFPNSMYLTEAQDYVAQVGQGAIADRSREHLGASDIAIVRMRRILRQEIARIREGKEHTRWENRSGPANLPLPPGIPRRTPTSI